MHVARRTMGFLTIAVGCLLASTANAERPNILLLVAEDLSPRIGSYGDTVAKTPNLDALAAESTRYTRAFTTAGVCAPSRAALITGQHQNSFGAGHMRTSTSYLGLYLAKPADGQLAFPEILRKHGYFTFTDNKLDYQFSGIRAGSGPFTIWDIDGAPDTAWREREPGQPFFGMVNLGRTHESGVFRPTGPAHSETHRRTQELRSTMIPPAVTDPADVVLPPYFPDLPEVRADLARHYDNISAMDSRVGDIVAALAADGILEQTIVIWTADHGDGLPRSKRELYDSGTRVPLLIRNPFVGLTPRVDNRLVSFVDFAPTILNLAGIEPPTYLHGVDLRHSHRAFIYGARDRIDEVPDRQRSIRNARFRYIRSWHPDVPGGHALLYRDNIDMMRAWRAQYELGNLTPVQARWFQGAGEEQLYDLANDPWETRDLARDARFREIKQRLSEELDRFLERAGDTGAIPEPELRAQLLEAGEVPRTPDPTITWSAGKAHLTSPIGASIGYRLVGDERWRLYVAPLDVDALTFKSVRYGWRESSEQTANRP